MSPEALLALISQLAMIGALVAPGPEGADTVERAGPEHIVEAVRRLCAP